MNNNLSTAVITNNVAAFDALVAYERSKGNNAPFERFDMPMSSWCNSTIRGVDRCAVIIDTAVVKDYESMPISFAMAFWWSVVSCAASKRVSGWDLFSQVDMSTLTN